MRLDSREALIWAVGLAVLQGGGAAAGAEQGTESSTSVFEDRLQDAIDADAADELAMLIARSDAGKAHLRTEWLIEAAERGSERVLRLLLEQGADINGRDGADWTPLHGALKRPGNDAARTRPVGSAMMLIEAGADVNAQTAVIGWTPLHLAAALNETGVARALLAEGANVNARTRLGGWTPLDVAKRLEDGGAEVAAVLREAGGVDTPFEGAQYLPVFFHGWLHHSREQALSGRKTHQDIHERLYNTPRRHWRGGGHAVAGSFTAPGADERLVFEDVGVVGTGTYMEVVGLVDRNGGSSLVLAADYYVDFAGLCLDSATGTHSAVFERSFDGACCPWTETVYLHYDERAGTLTEAFVDHDMRSLDPDGTCGWRRKMTAESRCEEVLATLRVGKRARLEGLHAADGTSFYLPTRVIPRTAVEPALATLDDLPNDVAAVTWHDLGDASRWKAVTVYTGRDEDSTRGGAALLWDGETEEWVSFFDDHDIRILGLDGDKLVAAAITGGCGAHRLARWCYFELDLSTFEARRISQWSDRLHRWR